MQSIEKWRPERVLKLPDHLFGQRVLHVVGAQVGAGASGFFIDALPLPDPCVVWSIGWSMQLGTGGGVIFAMALGNKVPGAIAEFAALPAFLPGVGVNVNGTWILTSDTGNGQLGGRMRVIQRTGGGRIVVYLADAAATGGILTLLVEVSSLPREVPDWFDLGAEADAAEEA